MDSSRVRGPITKKKQMISFVILISFKKIFSLGLIRGYGRVISGFCASEFLDLSSGVIGLEQKEIQRGKEGIGNQLERPAILCPINCWFT